MGGRRHWIIVSKRIARRSKQLVSNTVKRRYHGNDTGPLAIPTIDFVDSDGKVASVTQDGTPKFKHFNQIPRPLGEGPAGNDRACGERPGPLGLGQSL